ncbi:MAG TPA: N-formylglutamate amidohydrolase [Lacipirellulaceae bacterium]|mgnify:CR=1 FL=1|nr:N-formylglutamate amidohydrolase [Lacipirellulaceae bacterium]HMP08188.1 N-formylglutamate amidohydrolase [Lacipirellulaceae bacterium]
MQYFDCIIGAGPIVATAIHCGSYVRPTLEALMAVSGEERLREEDPFTDELAAVAATRLVGRRSRFEFDLNRTRDKAVYRRPEDAWGIHVWRMAPDDATVAETLQGYDLFYATARAVLAQLIAHHGAIVVLDIHTYNHRRDGPAAPPANSEENPEVNLGTGSLDRARWGHIVDGFMAALLHCPSSGRSLDVRENVRFRGGHFSCWVHENFPENACALAIEFKKTFMDEWTGLLDRRQLDGIQQALAGACQGLPDLLDQCQQR